MPYSLSWLAVRGKVTDLILEELNLRRTGATESAPRTIAGVETGSGWYVVIRNQDTELIQNAVLAEMSLECECVACFVEDASMVSSAVGWKHGKKIWFALHDGQEGPEHLSLRGEFPALFGPILDNARAQQKSESGKHLFEAPIILAQQLTGFRHDSPGVQFDVLQAVKPKKASLVDRIRGKNR